jgi:hypothetical protein
VRPKRIPELAELLNLLLCQQSSTTPDPHHTPLTLVDTGIAMLSRTFRRSIASPLRRGVAAPIATRPAFRSVTTDAASSHTERENVPQVGKSPVCHVMVVAQPQTDG